MHTTHQDQSNIPYRSWDSPKFGLRPTTLSLCLFLILTACGTTLFSKLNGFDFGFQGMSLVILTVFVVQMSLREPIDLPILLRRTWAYQIFVVLSFFIVVTFHADTIQINFWAYYIVGYMLLVFVPNFLARRGYLLDSLLLVLSIMGAFLAIPTILGAAGADSFLGLPINNKHGYAQFSAIVASSGIMDFPATMGPQFAMSLVAIFWWQQRNPRTLTVFVWVGITLIVVGLIITQARGALLGVALGWGMWVTAKYFMVRGMILVLLSIAGLLFPIFALDVLASIPGVSQFLRIERGLSGREGGWAFAITQMLVSPWNGHGFNAASVLTYLNAEQLKEVRFRASGASFHNTYLTVGVNYGVPAMIALVAVYCSAMYRVAYYAVASTDARFTMMMLAVATASGFFKDLNIGGLRSISVIMTIFLGYALIADFARRQVSTAA